MTKLVFDIETAGFIFESLPQEVQDNFLKYAENPEKKEEIKQKTGLYPVSGQVVAIAMLNPDTSKGKVYLQAPSSGLKDWEKDGVSYYVRDEKGILESFWKDVAFYDQLISYNGRGFDAPFIIFRSIYHQIKPSRNLMPYRYSAKEHLDLLDQLTFYGAFRRFSLEVLCQTFAIKNPKDEGVSGLVVNELFDKKEYQKIAEYCMRDVVATNELYNRVKDYIY